MLGWRRPDSPKEAATRLFYSDNHVMWWERMRQLTSPVLKTSPCTASVYWAYAPLRIPPVTTNIFL